MTERYRIDDLARLAGTTVRNVRSYQEKSLIPPPVREGRVAYYGERHLARLRTIGTLLERGFGLGNIAELFASWEDGRDIGDVLGLEAVVTSPFTDEEPVDVDPITLSELFRDLDGGALARALEVGLVERSDVPERVRVRSMRLLRAGAELHATGIPLDALFDELERLRDDTKRIADRFVALVLAHWLNPALGPRTTLREITDLIARARPLAKRVVDAELSRALETQIRAAFGERMSKLDAGGEARKKRKKRAS